MARSGIPSPPVGPNAAGGGGGYTIIDQREFSVSGTWTKPANAALVRVMLCGGGGGGDEDTSGAGQGSGGGQGGEIIEFWFQADDLSATEAVTIGAGGASNTDGGDTTFGTKLTAAGGVGGSGNSGGWRSDRHKTITHLLLNAGVTGTLYNSENEPGRGGVGVSGASISGTDFPGNGVPFLTAGGGGSGADNTGTGTVGGNGLTGSSIGAGGPAGTSGADPGAGAAGDLRQGIGGGGGGGGGSNLATGGAGGVPGGGGGGHDHSILAAGNGGAGGNGGAYIETWGTA